MVAIANNSGSSSAATDSPAMAPVPETVGGVSLRGQAVEAEKEAMAAPVYAAIRGERALTSWGPTAATAASVVQPANVGSVAATAVWAESVAAGPSAQPVEKREAMVGSAKTASWVPTPQSSVACHEDSLVIFTIPRPDTPAVREDTAAAARVVAEAVEPTATSAAVSTTSADPAAAAGLAAAEGPLASAVSVAGALSVSGSCAHSPRYRSPR